MTSKWEYALAFALVIAFAVIALVAARESWDAYHANTLLVALAWLVGALASLGCAVRVAVDAAQWLARDAWLARSRHGRARR